MDVLKANIRLNKLTKIRLINIAVGGAFSISMVRSQIHHNPIQQSLKKTQHENISKKDDY